MNNGRVRTKGVEDKPVVSFIFEGQSVDGLLGEPVAMSLWALGYRSFGWNEETGKPRSLYCGIGHCFECRMTINGQRDVRSCLSVVREGITVERQLPPPPLDPRDGMSKL